MGSGVLSILLAPIVYFLAKLAVSKYRSTVVAYVSETKYWKYFKATTIYKWYATYNNLYGDA
jgi:hypothetical protein